MTFAIRALTALLFATTIAAAAPHKSEPAPAAIVNQVKQTGVHRVLNPAMERGALKGVFGDRQAFANKLAKAMDGEVRSGMPR